ncbi:hypothetical protein SAMN02910456_00848 [Ruminococcaceae bacterium YRB3002]|nr:hypothetical protein SAMN02910456_00848 [Ruminococcaceae bacterium YRB3002]
MTMIKRYLTTIVVVLMMFSSVLGNSVFATGFNEQDSRAQIGVGDRAMLIDTTVTFNVAKGGSYTTPSYKCYTTSPEVTFYSCSGHKAHVDVYVQSTYVTNFNIPVTGSTTIHVPFSCNYGDYVYFVITAPKGNTSGSFTLHR